MKQGKLPGETYVIYACVGMSFLRLKRGAIHEPESPESGGANLRALRELTFRQADHEVDQRQSAYDEISGFLPREFQELRTSEAPEYESWERILIHIPRLLPRRCSFAKGAEWPITFLQIAWPSLYAGPPNPQNYLPRNARR
jgi:hypothetical protein